MIISSLRKVLKFFLIDNEEKLVVEFIGNPGSGKTTIIRNIYNIKYNFFCKKYKTNNFLNFIRLMRFLIHKNLGIVLTINKFIFISKYFLSDQNNISFKAKFHRLRKLFLILFSMLFKIYYSKHKVVYVESLLHQLIKDDFDQETFIENILFLYGRPKLKFVFLNCSVDESLSRMLKRGDNLDLNETILKRYVQANNTQKFLFKIIQKKYKDLKKIEKPVLIDSNNNSVENAKNLFLNIET